MVRKDKGNGVVDTAVTVSDFPEYGPEDAAKWRQEADALEAQAAKRRHFADIFDPPVRRAQASGAKRTRTSGGPTQLDQVVTTLQMTGGEMTTKQLIEATGFSGPALSSVLQKASKAGILQSTSRGVWGLASGQEAVSP